MQITNRFALIGLVGVLLAAPLMAQSPRSDLLVSPQWLSQHLHDPNVVLIHVGEKPEYDKGHIPGARYMEFNDFVTRQDPATRLTMQLPPDDTLRTRLERIGVSDGSRVIVYFSNGFVSPSTRLLFTLAYAGLNASLLDGGIGGWTRSGQTTTAEVTLPRPGKLSPLKTVPLVATAEYVRDNIGKPGIAVIDARAAGFYDGVMEGGPSDARKKGHIAGALSVPFTDVTADNLDLKSAEELGALFTKAGVKPGDTIIGYCHIGQQATAMLFAARTLGYKVALFDGSFEDWARRGWTIAVPPGK